MNTLAMSAGDAARHLPQPDPVQIAIWLDDGGPDLPDSDADSQSTVSQ